MGGRMVEMAVESVRVHMLSTQHVVILKDLERARFLPIWIGPWEANAIAMRLQGLSPERPLTHDLFAGVLAELGATIREVVIADLADETFQARIRLEAAGGSLEVDSRPSDALALAVRTGVRIFATEEVLERAGVESDEAEEDDELADEERLSIFRDFVNSLDAEPGPSGPREGPPVEWRRGASRGGPQAPAGGLHDRLAAAQRARPGSPTCAGGAPRSPGRRAR